MKLRIMTKKIEIDPGIRFRRKSISRPMVIAGTTRQRASKVKIKLK